MSAYWQKLLETAVYGQTLEILPAHLSAFVEWDLSPWDLPPLESSARQQAPESPYRGKVDRSPNGRHAVMSINGPLFSRLPQWVKDDYDLRDLNDINADLDTLGHDRDLQTVVLDINSPGGVAGPSSETAEMVRELGKNKRVIAYSGPGSLMASAAYKIAAGAHEIKASPFAEVGSIGTYMALRDDSAAWEKDGQKLHLFRDGKYKALGHPGKPLTEEEAAHLDEGVQAASRRFKAWVRENRKAIAETAMQGQTLSGRPAVEAGLIDGMRRNLNLLVADEIRRAAI